MKTPLLCKNVSTLFAVLILSIIAFGLVRCTPPATDNSYRKKLITHQEAKVLFDEYTRTNHRVLTASRNGNPDSRWYSFSIEEMEGYIRYVKENAKKQNLKNVGIKIYMGKYPADYPVSKMAKPEFAGYQTIFLMPTAKRERTEKRTEKRSRGTADENEKIESIQPMNMTNLSPPPNSVSANSMN